jgi:ribosomal protein S18 acetylase RimI-like enzyme
VRSPLSQPDIEIRACDRLEGSLREAARDLARTSFAVPGRTPEQAAEHRDRFFYMGDDIAWFVALHAGEVIGLTIAYQRVVDLAGSPLSLGGIGDVCVAPAFRRQGIARRLVQAAMQALDAAGCDVVYLCAALSKPGLTELYGQAGFVRIPQGHTFAGGSGRRYIDYDGMIAPVRSRGRFEQIVTQPEPFDIGRGNW